MSTLEIFPCELFVELFQFLSNVELLHAFLDLNDRLNRLIDLHLQNRPFSFQSISKQHFDRICHQHRFILPTNISSLHLSNDEETADLCELFLISGLTLDRFIHLQSLKLSHIDSFRTIDTLIFQCRHLPCLQKLDLIDCQSLIQEQEEMTIDLINNIWSLPSLVYCMMNTMKISTPWICQVSMICSTLEYLSIRMIDGGKNALYHLCKSIPNIRYLSIDVFYCSREDRLKIHFPFLISLKTCQYSVDSTMSILRSLPYLTSLTLELHNALLTGDNWQILFTRFLPNLQIFRLKMNFYWSVGRNRITRTNQLVDSYRTPFWIKEHQWYIRCDCYLGQNDHLAVLYTLPYAFDQCSYLNTYYSISTKPDDDQRYSHDRVQVVDPKFIRLDSLHKLKLLSIRFPNVHQIDIQFPWIDYSNIFDLSSFKQLRSLTVTLNDSFSYEQLQTFLHHTSRLYSLKVLSFGGSIDGFFQLTNSSIRRLDLVVAQGKQGSLFTDKNRSNFILSPLGRQCEVFLINLENANDILEFIEKMPHLRVLICPLEKGDWSHYGISSFKSQKLMFCLREGLSFQSSIKISSEEQSTISIWIYREANQRLLLNDETAIFTDQSGIKNFFYTIYLYLYFFLSALFISVFPLYNRRD